MLSDKAKKSCQLNSGGVNHNSGPELYRIFPATPVVPCPGMDDENEIYIKRDDLLPFSFGGNKVRIAYEYFADMEAKGKNCIIGYGNSRSNLCRAIANMGYAKYGAGHVHIVSPADDDGSRVETFNSRIVKICGAEIHDCSKQNVAETVCAVIKACGESGMAPYYINGDMYGKGNEAVPVRAYAKVYAELKGQYDYIFLATGTGMTQAGLLAGRQIYAGNENIVGISIARKASDETAVLQRFLTAYYAAENITPDPDRDKIIVTDQYLFGGYGKASSEITALIQEMMQKNGIPLDSTYTGKAFYGMLDYIRLNWIRNKRILFLHTGGTPLFFDNMRTI